MFCLHIEIVFHTTIVAGVLTSFLDISSCPCNEVVPDLYSEFWVKEVLLDLLNDTDLLNNVHLVFGCNLYFSFHLHIKDTQGFCAYRSWILSLLPLSCQWGCRNTVCCRWSACYPDKSPGSGWPLWRHWHTGRSRRDGGWTLEPGTGRPLLAAAYPPPLDPRSSHETN